MTTTVTVEENNISINLSDGVGLSSAAATMAENLASASGATLTGPLSFSGTTHRGLRLINLTTAQRDAVAAPGAGALIWNTTTGTVQEYSGSAWADVGGGGGAVDSVFGRGGPDVVAASGDYLSSQIADDSGFGVGGPLSDSVDNLWAEIVTLATGKQDADPDLDAIAALTPFNDDVIQRKAGAWTNRTVAQYVTDILAGWAAHVATFLQSANAADARTAIGAGTGNGDVTGPASSTDNAIARFDLTTGKVIQNSVATVDDSGNINLASVILTGQTAIDRVGDAMRIGVSSGIRTLTFFTDGGAKAHLDISGKFGVGVTSSLAAQVDVNQPSATAAIPALKLKQSDVSEEFIRLVGTSANGVLTQSIVEAADVVTPTIAGYVKIFIQDDGNQLTDQAYYLPVYTLA